MEVASSPVQPLRGVLVLYGSYARGDFDSESDVDLLLVSDEPEACELPAASGVNVTAYSWDEFSSMSQYGSLFLRHLWREARPVLGEPDAIQKYQRVLTTMNQQYLRVTEDLDAFRATVDDVLDSLMYNPYASIEVERRVLATVIRHLGVLYGYLRGTEDYSRLGGAAALGALSAEDIRSDLLSLRGSTPMSAQDLTSIGKRLHGILVLVDKGSHGHA